MTRNASLGGGTEAIEVAHLIVIRQRTASKDNRIIVHDVNQKSPTDALHEGTIPLESGVVIVLVNQGDPIMQECPK